MKSFIQKIKEEFQHTPLWLGKEIDVVELN